MKDHGIVKLIDAGFSGGRPAVLPAGVAERVPLLADSSEYCVAIRRLTELGDAGPAGRGVPDEIYLHLYCYELLERMRDLIRPSGSRKALALVLPFWPECLFQAAGLPVHAAGEIEMLFPPAEPAYYARRRKEVVEQEALRVLGGMRFSGDAYNHAMDDAARRYGWTLIATTG